MSNSAAIAQSTVLARISYMLSETGKMRVEQVKKF
jgi:hypothetical protein